MELVIDTNNPSIEAINFAWSLVNNDLWGEVEIVSAPVLIIDNTTCKTILDSWWSTWNGFYFIDIDWIWWNPGFSAYCDMTTDWWWWTRIIKDNTTNLSDLSDFWDTFDISSTFYSDWAYGIWWGTNDDTRKRYIVNIPYTDVKVKFTWFYNIPSWWEGFLSIDNETPGVGPYYILILSDAWTASGYWQSLMIWSSTYTYYKTPNNEINRTEIINVWTSSILDVAMMWRSPSFAYTKRYIWELWLK